LQTICLGLALNRDLLDLCLPRSYNYRHKPPVPDRILFIFTNIILMSNSSLFMFMECNAVLLYIYRIEWLNQDN
jgi:hypothetical protein